MTTRQHALKIDRLTARCGLQMVNQIIGWDNRCLYADINVRQASLGCLGLIYHMAG